MEEEEIKSRFSEEVKALGITQKAIAATIGFSGQTFTNVSSGRNMPGVLLLSRIKKFYPSFDRNYVITGVRSGDDSDLVKELRDEVNFQRLVVAKLAGKSKGVNLSPDRDKEFRKELHDSTQQNVRRSSRKRVSKTMSVHVQESTLSRLFA